MNDSKPAPTVRTISRDEWRATHKDFRSGDPRKGTATMLYFEPGRGTVCGPVTVVDDKSPTEARFRILRSDWRKATRALDDFRAAMRDKYGSDNWDTYALKGESDRYARLDAAERRTCERVYRLLDQTSGGTRWRSGVGCPFVRDELTFDQATSERPILPARALGYGADRRSVWFEVAS